MARLRGWAILLASGVFAGGLQAQDPVPGVVNWAAPLYWSARDAPLATEPGEGTLRTKTSTSPVPFIGITPCRIVDTRDANRPPGYGPPPLSPGVANGRTFVLAGQCGIAAGAQAVSLNVTVTNTLGIGYVVLYPQDGAFPPVSTLNYSAGQTVANAAVVPLGTGGAIRVVAGVSGTDLIIDTNGYYGTAGVGANNTFVGLNAGNFTMTGDINTAVGNSALANNTTGTYNAAFGQNALWSNNGGTFNSALGSLALQRNIDGNDNTAVGGAAMSFNTSGSANVAFGGNALASNTLANYNTAVGVNALFTNTVGAYNTAVGQAALQNSTGSGNIALGTAAGFDLTAGDNNLYLGNPGSPSESTTIRIGTGTLHTSTFIAAVRGVTTGNFDAVPVLIDSAGQLGTTTSSARFKTEVQDMDEASAPLLKLRPVTFRYRGQADERKQFGLIAEEVQGVLPELVVCGSSGEPETVLYHELPAMLVNELRKQQTEIERQKDEVRTQHEQIESLLARLRALEHAAHAAPTTPGIGAAGEEAP